VAGGGCDGEFAIELLAGRSQSYARYVLHTWKLGFME
jgi:hypothetical protein